MMLQFRRRLTPFVLATLFMANTGFAAKDNSDKVSTAAAHVRHVFMIVLENKSFADTFGASTQDPYLQKTLVPMGALLTNYYGTGHVSLDNYISMISGQSPTPDTTNDCLPGLTGTVGNFNDVQVTGKASDGQIKATGGCVYPSDVQALPNQLDNAGFNWRGYTDDMGNDPARESATCGHPPLGIGTDGTNSAEAPSASVPLGDAYATRHDPFMYFHSIIDSPNCKTNVVNLNNLVQDLASVKTTPNYVFITPNLCDDGHDGSGTGAAGTLCANGQPGGLTSADAFLKTWVPRILASPGTSCCNQQPGPNLEGVRPETFPLLNTSSLVENLVINGYGGDMVGALLISPFIVPGTKSNTEYNHYSLLKSIEDIFDLEHLGYAKDQVNKNYFLFTIGNDHNIFRAY